MPRFSILIPGFVWRSFTGKSQKDADELYYDVQR
jgi:hypothetical protein